MTPRRPDTKAIKARAEAAFTTDEEQRIIKRDVPVLCARVEELEAALHELLVLNDSTDDDLPPDWQSIVKRALAALEAE